MKRDALELRGADRPDEADALQARQGSVVDAYALPIPPHVSIRTLVRLNVKVVALVYPLLVCVYSATSNADKES
jgi:hypothetical protein